MCAVIEHFVVEGDERVRNLGIIGYLEGFQMATVTESGLDPEVEFRRLVGPASERWWSKINRSWAGDNSALQSTEP